MHVTRSLLNFRGRSRGSMLTVRQMPTGNRTDDRDRPSLGTKPAMIIPLGILLVIGLAIRARQWSELLVELAVVAVILLITWGVASRTRA